jgi:hypothetical protein
MLKKNTLDVLWPAGYRQVWSLTGSLRNLLLQPKVRILGILVDSEIVLSTRYGKTMVLINKTLSTETGYQQDLINRDLLSTRLIVGKVGSGMWCDKFNSTSNVLVCETQRKVNMYGCVSEWVGSVCVCVVCVCPLYWSIPRWSKVLVYPTSGQSWWCPEGSLTSQSIQVPHDWRTSQETQKWQVLSGTV